MKKTAYLAVLAAGAVTAHGQLAATAYSNATVRPGGVLVGSNGLSQFNVESNVNGVNASFDVADFNFGVISGLQVGSMSVSLVESDHAFSKPGQIDFYLTTNTSASIMNQSSGGGSMSTLTYQSGGANNGIDPVLYSSGAELIPLGAGMFNSTGSAGSGTVDTYSFSLTPQASNWINQQVASGGTVRLVLAADEQNAGTGTAATWAGYTNLNYTGSPTMTLVPAPVPEPASLALLGIGCIGLIARRRR